MDKRASERSDVHIRLHRDSYPIASVYSASEVMDSIPPRADFLEEVSVKLRFRMLHAEKSEEALVIEGFHSVKDKKGFSQCMQNVVAQLVELVPSIVFLP